MPTLWVGVRIMGAYVALIALGTFLVTRFVAPGVNTQGLWTALFLVQLAGTLLVMGAVWRRFDWGQIGFGRLRWSAILWLTPATVLLVGMAWRLWAETPAVAFAAIAPGVWPLILITPLLIAFSEETVFRGILLQGARRTRNVAFAMALSALAFGVAHLMNSLAGQTLLNTFLQTAFALLVGLSLAPIALRLGNLWPLIIWHWAWNVVILLSQAMGLLHPVAMLGMVLQAAVSAVLWTRIVREEETR